MGRLKQATTGGLVAAPPAPPAPIPPAPPVFDPLVVPMPPVPASAAWVVVAVAVAEVEVVVWVVVPVVPEAPLLEQATGKASVAPAMPRMRAASRLRKAMG